MMDDEVLGGGGAVILGGRRGEGRGLRVVNACMHSSKVLDLF